MRRPTRSGEGLLERALKALAEALSSTGKPWMIIGGVAVIAHGVRRMTTDIDAVVRGDALSLEDLARTLRGGQIVPRIARAMEFARANLVLLVRHEPTGVELDVSLGWTSFEVDALARCRKATYGSVTAPMARPEDLVVFKAMAARPKDIEDAAALLLMHRDIDVATARRKLGELAELAEEPSLVEGLETIVALAKRTAMPGKGTPRTVSRKKVRAKGKPRRPS